ncbi:hypothetical protein [Pseudonocardia sp. TMWB2A]|uniref:hypothetical protein n=1 Tax=Pseudonocardia sp. TMWB2A TaxID=687430 RepID=UPI00307CF2D7
MMKAIRTANRRSARAYLGGALALGLMVGGLAGAGALEAKSPAKSSAKSSAKAAAKKRVVKPRPIHPAGTYKRSRPNGGTLTITRQGHQWHMFVTAGGLPNGGATAADCEVAALGALHAARITARPVPWRSERITITPNDLTDVDGTVTVSFVKGGVQLNAVGITGPLCPPGSSFDGFYRRVR